MMLMASGNYRPENFLFSFPESDSQPLPLPQSASVREFLKFPSRIKVIKVYDTSFWLTSGCDVFPRKMGGEVQEISWDTKDKSSHSWLDSGCRGVYWLALLAYNG